MAEPGIGPALINWPFDDNLGYAGNEALAFRHGEMRLAENDRLLEMLGGRDDIWQDNDSTGIRGVAGDTVNGENAWDEDAADSAAFKCVIDAAVDKETNAIIPNTVTAEEWRTCAFWFYDDKDDSLDRRIFIGTFVGKSTPVWGVVAHPDLASPDITKYLFVRQLSGWTNNSITSAQAISTNVTRAAGWHFVLMAGRSSAAFGDRLILIMDNAKVHDVAGAYTSLVMPFGATGTRLGCRYFGPFTTKTFYMDTMRCWDGLRYPASAVVTFPPAQPERMGQFVSLSSDVTTLGVDIRGSIDEYYAISADGGGTYGNLKALNSSNLLAESMAGKGLDVIRPTGVITTSSPFTIAGLFSPRWVDLTIGYQGLWAEDLGGTDLWTEDT